MEGSKPSRRSWILPVALAVGLVGIIYVMIPCYRYFCDGLMAAIWIRDASGLFIHPHHPLHPLLPQLLYKALGGRSAGLSELELLGIWSTFAGIISTCLIALLLRKARLPLIGVLLGILMFGFTRAIWYFSVTPNQNSSAVMFQLFALVLLVSLFNAGGGPIKRGRFILVSIFISIAILSSPINAVLILPGLFLIWRGERDIRAKLLRALAFVGLVLLITLLLFAVAGYIAIGSADPVSLWNWQHSYVFQTRWWVGDFSEAINRNSRGIVDVHIASAFSPAGIFGDWGHGGYWKGGIASNLLKLGQGIFLLFFLVEMIRSLIEWIRSRSRDAFQTIGLLMALPIMLFSLVWAPESINYRVLYIPGLILFLLPGIVRHYSLNAFRWPKFLPVAIALISLLLVNLLSLFIPYCYTKNNPYIYEIMMLRQVVDDGDCIIYSGADEGHMRGLYAQYFLNCETFMVHELIPDVRKDAKGVARDLKEFILSGEKLIIHQDALASEEDRILMNRDYGIDLAEDEVSSFIDTWAEAIAGWVINSKEYYLLVPKDISATDVSSH